MKSWQFAVLASVCLAVAGCRTDPNITLLERELRLQEDEIYRLRGVVEDYQAALRSCQEGALPRRRSEAAEPGLGGLPGPPKVEGVPKALPETGSAPSGADNGRANEARPSPSEAPLWKPPGAGQPDGPSEEGPVQGPNSPRLPIPRPPDDDTVGNGAEVHPTGGTGPLLPANSRQVTQLTLDRRLTGGYDTDSRPGDEGILVVIQPQDAQGRSVQAPAEVSVAVLDPALQGEAARVARWDFTAAETATRFRKTGPGGAIQLKMLWPADPPVHSQLYLFVRYTTGDGRRLQAEGPIQITLPGQMARGWVRAKVPTPAREASRPADPGEPDQAKPRQLRPTPVVPTLTPNPASPAGKPAEPKLRPPVWSPNRA
jgi:hypothetical protein